MMHYGYDYDYDDDNDESMMHINHRIDTQPEVRLPWKLVPFFLCACPKYAINMPFWRHIDAILAGFFYPLGDICRLRRLTFCWRFVLIRSYMQKKTAVKTTGGTCQVAYWWRRWDARGHQHQRRRHGVGLLVDYLFCDINAGYDFLHASKWKQTQTSTLLDKNTSTLLCACDSIVRFMPSYL